MPNPTVPQAPASPKPPKASAITVMPSTLLTALNSLNNEIVYVRATSEIAELHPPSGVTRLKYMSPHDFKNADYSDRYVDIAGRKVFLAAEWMKWPQRRKVNRTVYEPGQPRITPDGDLNTWFPSPNLPQKGDCSLFHQYLDHLFTSDPTYKEWFLAWLAYPVQHLGAKLHTACVFWSTMTGTGKSTLAYFMKEIYGQHNCSLLREADLDSTYNGWAVNKQFAEVDEMPSGTRARRRAESLKSLTTRQTIPVDLKYQNRYEIRDTINYYYTSNHIESLYLDSHDRRFFVHNVGDNKLPEEFFRKQFGPWLKGGGFSHIHHYLLHEIDLSKPVLGGDPYSTSPAPFSPGAAAPLTKSRQAVIEAGYDDVEGWIRELVECPVNILGEDDCRTLFTSRELYDLFSAQFPSVKIGPQLMARKLAEQGLAIHGGKQIRVNGTKLRLFSINGDAKTRETITPETACLMRQTENS
jgi:hypothetical protein